MSIFFIAGAAFDAFQKDAHGGGPDAHPEDDDVVLDDGGGKEGGGGRRGKRRGSKGGGGPRGLRRRRAIPLGRFARMLAHAGVTTPGSDAVASAAQRAVSGKLKRGAPASGTYLCCVSAAGGPSKVSSSTEGASKGLGLLTKEVAQCVCVWAKLFAR